MTIAVWCSSLFKDDYSNSRQFIVETLLSLIQQHPDQKVFILTDAAPENFFPKNTQVLPLKPVSKNALLTKIWWDVRLPVILKKIKPDIFISFENRCSLTASIPQYVLIQQTETVKPAIIKKAHMVLVLNESMRNQLLKNHDVQHKKITMLLPFPSKRFKIADDKEKEHIKAEHSNGKEFFLFSSDFSRKQDFIELLKSFSHFKKRQHSSFKLLLLSESNSFFEKSLSSYKYRGDVHFIEKKNDPAMIVASAYAVVLPFNTKEDMIVALNSMQSGVPVIATKNSVISEMAGEAILCAEKEVTDIGDKLMQLYKDENYRSLLVAKGKSLAATFTQQKTAEKLWQSILKGLP
jgi:glycosyltransferase involved in cell wall biosynthesis